DGDAAGGLVPRRAGGSTGRRVTDDGPRTIFAMGGGGFTREPDSPVLDDYVVSLARVPVPRILFLPTASGDPTAQITAFHARYARRASATHLSLFRRHGSRRPP